MVESLPHLEIEDSIQDTEIYDHARRRVDLTANGHVADIAVTVVARTRAETEHLLVALV